tara:strand:+ start:1342 stop:1620 length:279 start_codon:yes stop_codon:yes gene_type:complete
MTQIQFVGTTPHALAELLHETVKIQLEDLKKNFQTKEPTTYLTRHEVAELIQVDKSTIHNLTVRGVLIKYQIGGRVLYKRHEVESAIIKLDK